MTTRATLITRKAPLASDFGEDFARRWFLAAELDKFPRYVRGEKKGRMKGWIVWTRAESGGWRREPGGRGHVLKPGDYESIVLEIDHQVVSDVCPWDEPNRQQIVKMLNAEYETSRKGR